MNTFETKDFDFGKWGAFFAFGQKQFDEKKKEGVKYVSLDMGLLAQKDNYKEMMKAYSNHSEDEKQRRIKEVGIDDIIKYELGNYECYYTGDLDDAWEVLKEYGADLKQVKKIFHEERDRKAMNDEI